MAVFSVTVTARFVADALDAWLNAHNVTEDKLRKLSK